MRARKPDEATAEKKGDGPLRVRLLWRHPLVASGVRASVDPGRFDVADARLTDSASVASDPAYETDFPLVVVESEAGSALSVFERVNALSPLAKRIVLAEDFADETHTFRLMRAGVRGFVTFQEIAGQMSRALESVAGGGFWVPRALLSRFVETTVTERAPRWPAARASALTPREREVLDELLKNLSNKEIARNLRISGRTAKFHVSNVMAKYGVKRRADLLLLSFPQH
jgi:DNA-binding NarL/FixJ family response regulator